MKKITLIIALLLSVCTYAQENDGWIFGVGVNAVNDLGSESPVENIGDWAFKTPIALSAEKAWSKYFSLEIAGTINGFDKNEIEISDKKYTYYALDTNVKYYFGDHIIPSVKWLDMYASAGVGMFLLGEGDVFKHTGTGNLTGNLGGGFLFWLNKNQTFGLKTQVMAKFAANNGDVGINTNHYQYTAQVIFKL